MISYRLTGQRKKHMNSKRRIAILLTLAIVVPLFACLNVSAAKTLTEGVSILNLVRICAARAISGTTRRIP